MVSKTLMWTPILNRFTYPCVLLGVLADEWSGVVINMVAEVRVGVLAWGMVGVDIIVVTPVVIVLEFVVPVPYVVDGLATVVEDIWVVLIIGVVAVNVNVLKGVMLTALKYVTAPSEEAFRYWPNAVLECARALQAWMPSDHV